MFREMEEMMREKRKMFAGILIAALFLTGIYTPNIKADDSLYLGYGDTAIVNIDTNAENIEGKDSESIKSLFDNTPTTKWYTGKNFNNQPEITWKYAKPVSIGAYTLVSANDVENRDPKAWTLSGSTDGVNFTLLDEQTENMFSERFEAKTFVLSGSSIIGDVATGSAISGSSITYSPVGAYTYYRLNITLNRRGRIDMFQLADIKIDGVKGTEPIKDVKAPSLTPLPKPTPNTPTYVNKPTVVKKTLTKPAKAKIKSIKKVGKKKVKITLSKAKNATSYQIRYKLSKKGRLSKKLNVKTLTKKITIKRKKTYYFQVRAVRTKNKVTVYSSWSKFKKYKMK